MEQQQQRRRVMARDRVQAMIRERENRAVYALREAAHSDLPCGDLACQVCWDRIDARGVQ